MCSKAPKPDPAIGQAAKQNADIAQQQLDVAKQQLAWEQDRAKVQDPLVQKIVDQQIAQGDTNAARADEQWSIYKNLFQPVESKMVNDAMNYDSPERQDMLASQAGADVTRGYQGAQDQNQRSMERMGVNPNSGRFAAVNNETNLAQAKDTAGAMNMARQNAITQGMALRTGAAQFGRNMPNTGLAADATALNAGNAAVGNMAQNNANRINSTNSALSWFGGATNANNSSANIGLGQYGAQLQGAQMNNDLMGGIGQLVGTLGSAAMLAKVRVGAVIKNNRAYGLTLKRPGSGLRLRPRGGGLSMLRRRGYAEGGMIEGPGTGTSDSIPATIGGEVPIKLSNGEGVLNTGAVQLLGEDAIHRLNAGGLMLLEAQKGGSQ